MKQKDILTVGIVIFVTAIISYFVSNKLFAAPANRQTPVEVVTPISAEFTQPDSRYFNKDSLDPTRLIQIGESTNSQPFNAQ